MKKPRPQSLSGVTPEIATGHGDLHVTINYEDGKPFEVFGNIGKAGGCAKASMEAMCRLVSLALRNGVDVEEVIDQLQGITCCPIMDNGEQVKSPADAIARVLKQHKSAPISGGPTLNTTQAPGAAI